MDTLSEKLHKTKLDTSFLQWKGIHSKSVTQERAFSYTKKTGLVAHLQVRGGSVEHHAIHSQAKGVAGKLGACLKSNTGASAVE